MLKDRAMEDKLMEERLMEALLEKITQNELERRIEEKINEFGGLLTKSGALLLLAKEMKISKEDKSLTKSVFPEISLSELKPKLTGISFHAKIERILPIRAFNKNGRKGKVCRLIIEDEGYKAILVLWDSDAERTINEIEKGARILVRNAYVKEDGEVHIGVGGSIIVIEKHREKLKKLSELPKEGDVDVEGTISEIYPKKAFEKKGKRSFVSSLFIKDETGKMRVVLWDEHTDIVDNVSVGDVVKIEGASVKNGESWVGWQSRILIKSSRRYSIKELKEGVCCEIVGKIKKIKGKKFIKNNAERHILIATLDDGDDGSSITTVFYDEVIKELLNIKQIPKGVDIETICELKGLIGKEIKVFGRCKWSAYLNKLEFIVMRVV